MLLFGMRSWKYIILLLPLAGCTQSGPDCMVTWLKLSDAQITFSARGQQFVIGDSTDVGCGITGVITMTGSYNPADSMFFIGGYTYGASINFMFLGPLKTGNFILDRAFVFPTDSFHCPAFHGSASIALGPESEMEDGPRWITDSLHTGFLTITSIDSMNHLYNAIFSFTGIDTAAGSPISDTVHVDNGVITKMIE
jgi:hypothetical protein